MLLGFVEKLRRVTIQGNSQTKKGTHLHFLLPAFPILVNTGCYVQFLGHLGLGESTGGAKFLDPMVDGLDTSLDLFVHADIVLYQFRLENDISISY